MKKSEWLALWLAGRRRSLRLYAKALPELAGVLLRPKTDRATVEARRRTCEGCPGRASDEKPLYRRTGLFRTCGVGYWRKPERLLEDGCGCLLNIKWRGPTQRCPHGRW